jgi:sulfatase maturation enzyme AslB (radical SAM superfamily)
VGLSFDGTQVARDAHRRTPAGTGTFELLLPRLRLLLAARPYSSVLMVVNPDTAAYRTESVEFLLAEGARYLILSMKHAGSWMEESLEVLRAEYEKLWQGSDRRFTPAVGARSSWPEGLLLEEKRLTTEFTKHTKMGFLA